ncbi:hypothetical protein JVU11DRAFT_6163 [Chiua virens]|nr:hypothetical protein JVU11DRAFT_6163 [Chiua virens]
MNGRDINALIEFIGSELSEELDSPRIAVMGGSCNYSFSSVSKLLNITTFRWRATLAHYSSKLRCAIANFGIGKFVTFRENTAPVRHTMRRLQYGDESDPVIRTFLEHISSLNNVEKTSVPLFIMHCENDTRVTVHETVAMYRIVQGRPGERAQMVICEAKDTICFGLGYKQKCVIEYTCAVVVERLTGVLIIIGN